MDVPSCLLLALALVAPLGPAKQGPAKLPNRPAKASKAKSTKTPATLTKVPRLKKRAKVVAPNRDPKAAAAMAGLIAHATSGKGKDAERLRKRMRRHGISTKTAEALVGASKKGMGGTVARDQLIARVENADRAPMIHLRPVITLPPQAVSLPASYALDVTGLVTTRTADADGTDELSALAIVVTVNGQDYDVNTVDLGSMTSSVGSRALDRRLFDAAPGDALFVSVLTRGDAATTSAAKTKADAMVRIAASAAADLPGDDRLQVLRGMIDYTFALDDLNFPPDAATRSVVTADVASSEWENLWAADPTEQGGVRWKVALPHAIGSGRYEMLLDVPSDLPDMPVLRLSMTQLNVGVPSDLIVRSLKVTATIGDAAHEFELERAKVPIMQPIERKVIDTTVGVGVSGHILLAPDLSELEEQVNRACAQQRDRKGRRGRRPRGRSACKRLRDRLDRERRRGTENRTVDFAAGAAKQYETDYSTTLGSFVLGTPAGPKSPGPSAKKTKKHKPVRTRTAKGNEAPRGTVKLSITQRD